MAWLFWSVRDHCRHRHLSPLQPDLHAAYWPNHGGGLRRAGSFIETAKAHIDRMHVDYLGETRLRNQAADRTGSIHFYDSLVVFEVGAAHRKRNQTTGQSARFDDGWAPEGVSRAAYAAHVDEALQGLEKEGPEWKQGDVADQRDETIGLLAAELALLRGSTSWRLTRPLRMLGRLLKRA